ncbi:uncharacterized protein K452DRAFT_323352 [Aplosporella prunicola CBS 121167]|uniref:TEA domain-containing protein n=1 Tax=Aplosporella prunicola CBS 121167 TaxID=1176127 RepID=A0A6A6BW89_9PEZI|nr:uncharacterized protein K452DRAFT_323352 [Aplosporella prunicola CBS 121167]KAF2147167.1 hypothetical protein K452DRAFT_323352 [Aplosporella prunicola CBS 121167]
MPPVRPHLSVTLPKNFTFHYSEGELPKTPEPTGVETPTEPPQIPRQAYRVRRRRQALPTYAPTNFENASKDLPIPTIEAPEPGDEVPYAPFSDTPSEPEPDFLSPNPPEVRLISPPKTPIHQIGMDCSSFVASHSDLDSHSQAESFSRPSSACSGISDSSVSSRGSMDSYPSYGGSCTTPESEDADPFVFPTSKINQIPPSSPLQAYAERPTKRLRTRKDTVWTREMDNHLWLTYMMALQDPTVTPFKMLPGTVPPLGICTRVARQAKKTWKGALAAGRIIGHPDTGKHAFSDSHPSATHGIPRPGLKWPRSEAAARGRLRILSKKQPMLAAHYQRLLQTRTPSPFPSSPQSSSSSGPVPLISPFRPIEREPPPTFSTRDMNVSLATSTSTTMQFGNPLHALATEDTQGQGWRNHQHARSNAHQKSQSLQLGLGLGSPVSHDDSSSSLASPFVGMSRSYFKHESSKETPRPVSQPVTRPSLDSPVELHAPVPITRSFKRRAHQYLEDMVNGENPERDQMGQNFLHELFGAPADTSHRRIRSRGFSLGDMGSGARQLSNLFTPPPSFDQGSTDHDSLLSSNPPTDEANITTSTSIDPRRRLGSPFQGGASHTWNNTFPRVLTPRMFESSASFEERFGGLGG